MPATNREPQSWLQIAVNSASKNYRLIASYFIGICALSTPLLKVLPEDYRYLPAAAGILILLISMIYHGRGAHRDWILQQKSLQGQSLPRYFRLAPYQDTDPDRKAFRRVDDCHGQVLQWLLNDAQGNFRYLSGRSGSGKSSLLNAYAIPELRKTRAYCIVKIRSYRDLATSLSQELLRSGTVWKHPPTEPAELTGLLEKAARHLQQDEPPRRLFLVFDQFEEFLTIGSRHPKDREVIADVFQLMHDGAMAGLTTLLVLRDDELGSLEDLQARHILPRMRQEENWKIVPGFSEQNARDFLAQSGLQIPAIAMEQVFQHINQIEGGNGQIRPITLNMVGLVIERMALMDERRIPPDWSGGKLLREYIRRSLNRYELQEYAPHILRKMITSDGARLTKSLEELAEETKIDRRILSNCLTLLEGEGLVRHIEDVETVWEVSHDFVARIMADVLSTWRLTYWRRLKGLLSPAREQPWFRQADEHQIKLPLPNGETLLHLAARHLNDTKAVEYFLEHGADLEAPGPDGLTPLHVAVDNNNLAVVRVLLKRRAKIDAKNRYDATPLHGATNRGHSAVAALLLECGADIGAKNGYGATPLHDAASNGHRALVELLLDKDAEVNAKNKYGATPLHDTTAEVAALLLSRGADIKAKNDGEATPLHDATGLGRYDVVALLIEKGADLSAKNSFGATPLHDAAINGRSKVAGLLLDKGAPIDARNDNEASPLHDAASRGHPEVAALLLERGADIGAKNGYGATPLHDAASNGHCVLVELLLDKDAEVNAKNKRGATSLHDAASRGYRDVASLLLERGADISAKNNDGCTPLHDASVNNHLKVARVLLQKGADLNAKDQSGRTAFQLAVSGPMTELLNGRCANDENA